MCKIHRNSTTTTKTTIASWKLRESENTTEIENQNRERNILIISIYIQLFYIVYKDTMQVMATIHRREEKSGDASDARRDEREEEEKRLLEFLRVTLNGA